MKTQIISLDVKNRNIQINNRARRVHLSGTKLIQMISRVEFEFSSFIVSCTTIQFEIETFFSIQSQVPTSMYANSLRILAQTRWKRIKQCQATLSCCINRELDETHVYNYLGKFEYLLEDFTISNSDRLYR